MKNKYVGYLIIAVTLIFGFIVYSYKITVEKVMGLTCTEGPQCAMSQGIAFLTNVSIGLMALLAIVGLYLSLFSKDEVVVHKQIIRKEMRPRENREETNNQKKFDIIMSALNEDEKKVILAVKDQEGITQSTLKFRTDFSKAKLSIVLSDMEKRGLITRAPEGNTYKVYLKKNLE